MITGMSNKPDWNKDTQEDTNTIGQQLMEYVHRVMEGDTAGKTKEEYAQSVYAKAQSGKKLTPAEMSFLARTNPMLYQKVLRAQALRNALESKLKSCKSKEEAGQVFSAAVSSISKNDPDRDIIIAALNQAYKEFKESSEYMKLPEKTEDETGKKSQEGLEYTVNCNGYMEIYEAETFFLAKG